MKLSKVGTQSQKLAWGLLAAAVLASLLARMGSLNLPLDRDEGEYATLAMAWLQGHGIPYRDFLEQKPPLAVLLYAPPQWLGFASVTALRLTVLCWQGLATGLFFCLALKVTRSSLGRVFGGTALRLSERWRAHAGHQRQHRAALWLRLHGPGALADLPFPRTSGAPFPLQYGEGRGRLLGSWDG